MSVVERMTVDDFIKEWRSELPYIVAHTSGSTGVPKEVRIDKRFAEASAIRTNKFFGITSDSHLHLCLSPDYIAGKMMIIRALVAGAKFTYETPSNEPLCSLNSTVKLLAVVPSQVDFLLCRRDLLSLVENLLVGGSSIPVALRKRIADSGVNAYESYGMTETASHIALRRIKERPDNSFETFPDITVSLGAQDNLMIDMPGSHVVTRDVARLVDACHFHVVGRLDNAIISGGFKIHPEEVESDIESLLEGYNFFIGSLPDDKWGERVVLCIEGEAWRRENVEALQHSLAEQLPPYQRPKEVVFMPGFNRTSTGKLIRKIEGKSR